MGWWWWWWWKEHSVPELRVARCWKSVGFAEARLPFRKLSKHHPDKLGHSRLANAGAKIQQGALLLGPLPAAGGYIPRKRWSLAPTLGRSFYRRELDLWAWDGL